MLLKVGELAKRAGLTVRTLHHYDHIGLLHPTGRSEGGYRLYSRDDVARLHGIQMLRRMGLTLSDVAQWLDGGAGTGSAILLRQIDTLDQHIAQSLALRERLGVMQSILAGGRQPATDDWLASLSLMNTFEQHFSTDELKRVFERWTQCKSDWPPLLRAVREAMDRGVPPASITVQPLARQWMEASARWMDGDWALLQRWGGMLRAQPGLPLPEGMDRALWDYIDQAVRSRLALLAKYLGADELQRLDLSLAPEWRAFNERAERLLADGVPPHAESARQLARSWHTLVDRWARHDRALRDKLLLAYQSEPLVRAGAVFTEAAFQYVQQVALDPHAA